MTKHYVWCDKCKCNGPMEYKKKSAIDSWNSAIRKETINND